ncbi:hypothetical protein VOLCADRAFT_105657 [Volvox carteri f. nagariensis]|uniref:Uncharacterized protein n=1 Tax=Volvox carteri f. nagariensis TaxID=3068 RepID=D8U262_VOLCA|nr:uncharacterized protein VOLCADRAFT_105657 [Volvox carteri f. nagariensis]EFJ46309.1 hypothetical protein VOLCADRAFT_105657 [Volvox carteri f. nagariensis]|eukprot:XP_002952756.1 hypothetical protein VOLCADRAFT_105657 [Volvox carteri f. nagariensis]
MGRCLKGFKSFKDLGGPRLVRLQLYVRRGDTVFRDELEWDVNDPAASTLQYACEVCVHLHLDLAWAQAISSHLHDLVHEVVEDLRKHPEEVSLLPPTPGIWHTTSTSWEPLPPGQMPPDQPQLQQHEPQGQQEPLLGSSGQNGSGGAAAVAGCASGTGSGSGVIPRDAVRSPFPRIEAYDPATDLEAERRARREAKAERRKREDEVRQHPPRPQPEDARSGGQQQSPVMKEVEAREGPPGQGPSMASMQQQQQSLMQPRQVKNEPAVGQTTTSPLPQQQQQLPPPQQQQQQQATGHHHHGHHHHHHHSHSHHSHHQQHTPLQQQQQQFQQQQQQLQPQQQYQPQMQQPGHKQEPQMQQQGMRPDTTHGTVS